VSAYLGLYIFAIEEAEALAYLGRIARVRNPNHRAVIRQKDSGIDPAIPHPYNRHYLVFNIHILTFTKFLRGLARASLFPYDATSLV
jgi:hypothetical protein